MVRDRELNFWENVHHPQHVTCHVSRVTCHMYLFIIIFLFFIESAPLGRFDLVVAMSVCLSVCMYVVPFHAHYFEAYFAPPSRSRMSKIFRDSESLGKSSGKKWSQNWTFLLGSGLKSSRKKKLFFCWFFGPVSVRRLYNDMRRLYWDMRWLYNDMRRLYWDMRRLYRYDAVILRLVFFLDKSLKLSKIVLVLRSASVERFDVSRMRDFLYIGLKNLYKNIARNIFLHKKYILLFA